MSNTSVRSTLKRILIPSLIAVGVLAATRGAQLEAATRNFLWKATRGQSVVYLVGSVHLLSRDYYPLSPALDAAFKDCDLLVEELDLGEMGAVDSQFKIL